MSKRRGKGEEEEAELEEEEGEEGATPKGASCGSPTWGALSPSSSRLRSSHGASGS